MSNINNTMLIGIYTLMVLFPLTIWVVFTINNSKLGSNTFKKKFSCFIVGLNIGIIVVMFIVIEMVV